MRAGSYGIRLNGRSKSGVAGRLFFILVIIIIACAYPAHQYCNNCNQQAAQECIVEKQQQMCHYSCDADDCGTSGTCEYVCCDNPGAYYGKFDAVVIKKYEPGKGDN